MNASRVCILLKMLFQVLLILTVGFAAAICGCFGIALFVFAGRYDWGFVFLLAPAVMLSMDVEELHFELRRLKRRAAHED